MSYQYFEVLPACEEGRHADCPIWVDDKECTCACHDAEGEDE